jgi:hypothetical protein
MRQASSRGARVSKNVLTRMGHQSGHTHVPVRAGFSAPCRRMRPPAWVTSCQTPCSYTCHAVLSTGAAGVDATDTESPVRALLHRKASPVDTSICPVVMIRCWPLQNTSFRVGERDRTRQPGFGPPKAVDQSSCRLSELRKVRNDRHDRQREIPLLSGEREA